MKKYTIRRDADTAYRARRIDATLILARIQAALDIHSSKMAKSGTWDYVGDLGRLVENLKESYSAIGGEYK